jgi:hypothetical protein
VHVHDIFIPLDYPVEWSRRYYSEQYLLSVLSAWGTWWKVAARHPPQRSSFRSTNLLYRAAERLWSGSERLRQMVDPSQPYGGIPGVTELPSGSQPP